MKKSISLLFLLSLLGTSPESKAQDQLQTAPAGAQPEHQAQPAGDPTQPGQQGEMRAVPAMHSPELDLPLDESVKLTVQPVQISNIVDRVKEPVVVTIKAPGASSADVYILPVDAPYGGHALGKPILIGSDSRQEREFKIRWVGKVNAPYVKMFAVIHKKNPQESIRSRMIDLSVGSAPKPSP